MQNEPLENKFKEKYEEIWQGLGSYFHQDVLSLPEGIAELINNSNSWLEKLNHQMKNFIADSEFSLEEKKYLIQKNISLRFDTRHLDPLEWLEDLAKQIEEKLKQA